MTKRGASAHHRLLAGRYGLELDESGRLQLLEARRRLRDRRLERGATMRDVERAAAIASGTLSRLEGVRGFAVSREKAQAIAVALDSSIEELFTADRTQRSRRGGRRVPPLPKGAPAEYMRDELARIEAEANARGLLTIDQVCAAFRRAAATSAEVHRRRWRPAEPHRLPTYTRQAVNYYVSRGELAVAERVPLSTGKSMRLFNAVDVDELARTRFAFPNGNVREWEEPTDALRGSADLLSGRARQKVKGRWGGAKPPSPGARPRGRQKTTATPEQVRQIRRLAERGWGRRAISAQLMVSERLVRNVLEAA